MISKNQVKFLKSLHQSKYRRKEKLFLAEGVKIVDEFIKSNYSIKTIYAIEEWVDNNADVFDNINEVSLKELHSISLLKTPNQVLAVVEFPEDKNIVFDEGDLILALDTIQDPGNLGTIIRIADWFGIKKIICSKETADALNPKVVQATMGALTRVDMEYTDLPSWIAKLPDTTPVYGTLLDGENMYDTDLSNDGVIVVGNEGNGITSEVQKVLTHRIKIPAYGNSMMESLNVAIATSLVCAEFRR